jgi:2-polyprenyl-6-methoxyphenol hydroxylase-like FAD-dependent oxidoreductase
MSTNVSRRGFVCSGLAIAAGGLAVGDPQAKGSSSKETVTEPAQQIPVLRETDVVVCGGGPAGAAAAIAAARNGANTVLVEYQICLGGMAGSGMLNRLGPFHDREKIILGGIPWEIVERLVALKAAFPPRVDGEYWIPFDPEAMKYVLDRLVDEAGVKVLFHALAAGIVRDQGEPIGVFVESKSGRQAILAKVIIDATGDADVAASAGAAYEKGRRQDGWTSSEFGAFLWIASSTSISRWIPNWGISSQVGCPWNIATGRSRRFLPSDDVTDASQSVRLGAEKSGG